MIIDDYRTIFVMEVSLLAEDVVPISDVATHITFFLGAFYGILKACQIIMEPNVFLKTVVSL